MACIYQIKNIVNNKIYIGSTIRATYIRKYEHFSELRNNKHCNNHLQKAWNKYGEDKFEFSILETFIFPDTYSSIIKVEYLTSREFYLINLLSANYNIKKDITIGNTGYKHSEETKRKISESNKTKTPSKKTLEKRERETRRVNGVLNTNYKNRTQTLETKQKIRERSLQKDNMDRMSSLSKLGNDSWKGRQHSIESKIKMLKTKFKCDRIIEIYKKDTNQFLYSCNFTNEASQLTGVLSSAIRNNLVNLSKSSGGFIFKYKYTV